MNLPSTTQLDQMAYLIAQCKFHDILVPEGRALVMDLVLKQESILQLEGISGQIESLREDMDKQNSALLGRLESMETDTTEIAEWFKNSRTFDGVGELAIALERAKS